jgi:hypothetical protein
LDEVAAGEHRRGDEMDMRMYYRKVREVEATIPGTSTSVVSLATPDGGKEGTITEVPRRVAAKMIVDGTAKLATESEIESRTN